jgi:ABC-type Co2+ transport system permease subunit
MQEEVIMHIEPGIVSGAKMLLSHGTAAAAFGIAAKLAWDELKAKGLVSLAVRTLITTALVFSFFEVLPHFPKGISEVHFIFGTTLYLLFGPAAAAFGLASGLGLQGLLFAPADLPQYGVNVSTLLFPLFAIHLLAKRIIPADTPYTELGYGQVLKLSLTYQAGIISWVMFWALYGQGFGAENLANIGVFAGFYIMVVLVEPFVDLTVLAIARNFRHLAGSGLFASRLFSPASSQA